MKILHFRKKLFLFLLVVLLVFFLTIFVGIPNSNSSTKNLHENDKIAGGSILMKTAIFPRGGDQMHFDQPWKMPEAIIYSNLEDLIATQRRQKFIVSDFSYR
jgi:hypothetical protein